MSEEFQVRARLFLGIVLMFLTFGLLLVIAGLDKAELRGRTIRVVSPEGKRRTIRVTNRGYQVILGVSKDGEA